MLGSCDVVAFISTVDPVRARAFYEGQLGLRVMRTEPSGLVFDANGTVLRLRRVPAVPPSLQTVLGWSVPSIDETVRAMAAADVTIERFATMQPDGRGVRTLPNGDQVAWFKDPDGNTLSVTQLG